MRTRGRVLELAHERRGLRRLDGVATEEDDAGGVCQLIDRRLAGRRPVEAGDDQS